LIEVADGMKEENCKYHYILGMIDYFSKKAWAKPLKNKKKDQIANIIDKFFRKMYQLKGKYPLLLHTDMGTYFRNEELQNVCTFKGVRLLHGAAYHS
jgi:hypothetical protein